MIINGIIYKVVSPSGKIYIGKTIQSLNCRKLSHMSDAFCKKMNTKFCNAIRKYKNKLKWEILFKNLSKEELYWYEVWLILFYNSYKKGYNSTVGGEGTVGLKHTSESKLKISNSKKNKKSNFSIEERKNRSIRVSGKNNPMYGLKGVDNPNFGLKRDEKLKKQLSKIKLGVDNPMSYEGIMYKNNCSLEEAKKIRASRYKK